MERQYIDALLSTRDYRVAADFYCAPGVTVRRAEEDECRIRRFHTREDAREILLVLEGEVEMVVGDFIYGGGPGTLFLIPPGVSHEKGAFSPGENCRYFRMVIWPLRIAYSLASGSRGEYNFSPGFGSCFDFDPDFNRQLARAWDDAAAHRGDPEYLEELMVLIRLRAVQLSRITREWSPADCSDREVVNRRVVRMVMHYIEQQCGRDCGIARLAAMTGYSRSRFLSIFSRHAQCTVLEFVDRQRVRRCRELGSGPPAKFVARELGFGSTSSFIHWRNKHLPREKTV